MPLSQWHPTLVCIASVAAECAENEAAVVRQSFQSTQAVVCSPDALDWWWRHQAGFGRAGSRRLPQCCANDEASHQSCCQQLLLSVESGHCTCTSRLDYCNADCSAAVSTDSSQPRFNPALNLIVCYLTVLQLHLHTNIDIHRRKHVINGWVHILDFQENKLSSSEAYKILLSLLATS